MKASMESLVEMRGVKLQFGDKVILDGIDFTLQAHEVLVIMGLSGSGKSTLLNLLIGLLVPNAGAVFFKKEEITQLNRPALNQVRQRIGMVYQNAALVSSLTVRDNIALPLEELSDKTRPEIDAIVEQKLALVGLTEAKRKLPSELSGGMQKRVGLARALVLEPELVLFDEPSAGLDPINSRLIADLIINLREQQKTTSIVVTHELDSAFAVATRMAFLHEGKMIFSGQPAEFREAQQPVIRQFLSAYEPRSQQESAHANTQK
jgi:phospholipid/cholesterol/gamma-HCH transport system ATP-binding protein